MMPGNKRRLLQLIDVALNLGMSDEGAKHYAAETLLQELKSGNWHIKPQSTEALVD